MLKLSNFENISDLIFVSNGSNFMQLFKEKWDKLHNETNVFRYNINTLLGRHVNGYLLQLNPDRGTRRRTPEQIDNISQPFNVHYFNFTQVQKQEMLFHLVDDDDETKLHCLLVNVSPISRYHSLLCPNMNACLPQVANKSSIKLALRIMFIAQDRDLRVGFNSLCALASVNHLHYHLLIEKNTLPVETVECIHIKRSLYRLNDKYPAPGFCFEVSSRFCIEQMSIDIYKLLQYLIEKSIAHNVMITRGLPISQDCNKAEVLRVVVWPRKSSSGVKQLTAFNVALCELSGWFPVYDKEHFNNLQSKDIENELNKWRIENFEELCEQLKSLF